MLKLNLLLGLLIIVFICSPYSRWYWLVIGLMLKMVEVLLTPYLIWRHNMKE